MSRAASAPIYKRDIWSGWYTMDDDSNFEKALAQVMRPMARAMIAQSVPMAQATEILKQAYVSAAIASEPSAKATDSRISLLTGIHRKDVKRLRGTDPRPPKRPMLNACVLAVAVWSTDKAFVDADGKPRALLRPDLDELVKKARIDVPVSTLVTALMERGMTTQSDPDGPLELITGGAVGSRDERTQIISFEKNISAHLEAAVDNLTAKGAPPHFERAAHFNQLSTASLAKLKHEARARLQTVLVELNEMALALQDEDLDKDETGRFTIGGYVQVSPLNDGDDDDG